MHPVGSTVEVSGEIIVDIYMICQGYITQILDPLVFVVSASGC